METPSSLYFVMEYASNGNLMECIRKKKKLEEEEARRVMVELLDALDYIHSIGVAHRDVKPENILIDRNNTVKLGDFGLGKIYERNGVLNSSRGSPCYASPEMLRGGWYQPSKCDVWSAGVVLYLMVLGTLPFDVGIQSFSVG